MNKQKRRLYRQFKALETRIPRLKRPIRALLSDRRAVWRIPLGLAMILGGLFSFLPVLGLWMLPLGLLLLAVDVKPLQSPVSALAIRARRRLNPWLKRRRGKRSGKS